jgi:predicted adenylyl cyclase CyaB
MMAANIEIKARIKDPVRLRRLAEEISDTPGQLIPQEDIFFHSPSGRLKLRVLGPDEGQLIYYEREDATGPTQSNYLIAPTNAPDALKTLLTQAFGVRGVVRKNRTLFLVGNTRIHLDEVESLGSYMELEVVLGPEEGAAEGQAIAADLMARLGIKRADLVDVAYIDLLEGRVHGMD